MLMDRSNALPARSRGFITAICIILAGCAEPSRPRPSFGTPGASAVISGSMHFDELGYGLIIVEASTTASKSYFIVDTGFPCSALDINAFPGLPALSESILSKVLNGYARKFVLSPPHVKVGPFDLASGGVCEYIDLSEESRLLKANIVGVIGATAFSGGILQIDFRRHEIIVGPSDGEEHPEWGNKRPCIRNSLWYWQSTFELDGRPTSLDIDTGSNGFVDVTPSLMATLLAEKGAPRSDENTVTAYGTDRGRSVVAARLRIDDRLYTDVHIYEPSTSPSAVGTAFLRHFLVTIDFRKGILYLRPFDKELGLTHSISPETVPSP